jgi:hypothetical protein
MPHVLLRRTSSATRSWPISGRERLVGVAAAAALLLAEAGGRFGEITAEERERLRGVLSSAAASVPELGAGSGDAGEAPARTGPTGPFVRLPGQSAADAVRHGAGIFWSHAEAAVFAFRRGDDLGAGESLRRALYGLGGAFSPSSVRRELGDDGAWVIRDVAELGSQGFSGQAPPSETEGSAVQAGHLLLSYFVQRVLNLASEAFRARETLERTFLRVEAS